MSSDRPLWKHQKDAIEKALTLDQYGRHTCPDLFLAMEMGVGKTRCVVEIMRRLFAKDMRVLRTLIVAPIIVLDNWKNEIAMFSKIKPHDVVVLRGSGAKRLQTFVTAVSDGGVMDRGKIIIMNSESLQMPALIEAIEFWKPEVLVVDEAHIFKNHASKRAKRLAPIADRARHRYMLTGTPILNTPMDIFMQFRLLDGGATFTKNFYSFRNTYFADKNAGFANRESHFPKYEPIAAKYPEMREKILNKTARAVKADCLDLPPLIRQTIVVEMSAEQKRMYAEMKKDFVTWIEDRQKGDEPRAVIAQLAITKALRMQQIVSGYVKADNGDVVWIEDNPRIKAVRELLEGILPNKVIIWAIFKENYKMLEKMCIDAGYEYAMINGDLSENQKLEHVERFTKTSTCNVMIANQSAGGVGINLVESNYSLYFSKNFSLKDDLQSEARNYRGGSERHESVTRIDIVCPDTIDETINKVLASKQDVAGIILDSNFIKDI